MFIQIINFNIFDKNFTRASEEVGAVVSGCPVLENMYWVLNMPALHSQQQHTPACSLQLFDLFSRIEPNGGN
jgi:hypothetical protein